MRRHVSGPGRAVSRWVAILCLIGAFKEPAAADDGKILGSVVDPSATGVPDATVTALNFETVRYPPRIALA